MTRYLLDTNFFIQAHRSSYPLDIAQSFWAAIKELADKGYIISIDKVKKEIYDKSSHEDELMEWCSDNLSDDFFVATEGVISNYIKIIQWASSPSNQYITSAVDEFLQADLADPWLVAYALEANLVIVTYEVSAPQAKKKIKIPEVCNHFGVRYINPIEMLRELQLKF